MDDNYDLKTELLDCLESLEINDEIAFHFPNGKQFAIKRIEDGEEDG